MTGNSSLSNIYLILISEVLGLTVLADVRFHRIPNILLMILFVINFLFVKTSGFNLYDSYSTQEGMLLRIGYVALIGLFLFPFFSIGAIGAGDLKLIVIMALIMEKPFMFFFMVFILAALIGITKLIVSGEVRNRAIYLSNYFRQIFYFQSVEVYLPSKMEAAEKTSYSVHLSIPVFLATLVGKLLKIV